MSAPNPIGHRFGLQATRYDAVSEVQQYLAAQLWKSAQPWLPSPLAATLDIGSGTGHLALHLAQAKPQELHLLDLSASMLSEAQAHLEASGATVPLRLHVADAEIWSPAVDQPPFDFIGSSAALQWFCDLPRFLERLRTWKKATGVVALATFGPQTLCELHAAYVQATGMELHGGTRMQTPASLILALQNAGFQIHTSGCELYHMPHSSARGMLGDLKSMGVTGGTSKALTRTQLRTLEAVLEQDAVADNRQIRSTWELVWVVAT